MRQHGREWIFQEVDFASKQFVFVQPLVCVRISADLAADNHADQVKPRKSQFPTLFPGTTYNPKTVDPSKCVGDPLVTRVLIHFSRCFPVAQPRSPALSSVKVRGRSPCMPTLSSGTVGHSCVGVAGALGRSQPKIKLRWSPGRGIPGQSHLGKR